MAMNLRSSSRIFKNHAAWSILVKTVKLCLPIKRIRFLLFDHNSIHATISVCCTVILGCTPKRPAESCLKINASGEGKLVSGNYWLKGMKLKEVYKVITSRIKNMPVKIYQSWNLCRSVLKQSSCYVTSDQCWYSFNVHHSWLENANGFLPG